MPDTASVTLEVAPSDKLQQLVDQITAMTGGGGEGGGGGGGGRQNMAGRIGKMGKAGSKMVQTGLKKAGVSFSLSAMLKQSQIFTGFLGSLFQILGGFLDVLLAPLIPILMPLLVFLGRMIPVVGKIAQLALGPVVFIIELIMKVVYWLLDGVIHVFDKYLENILEKWEAIKERFETAWGYITEGKIWEATKEMLGGLWDLYMAPISIIWDTLFQTGADIWEWLSGFELIQDMTTAFNTWYDNTISPFFDDFKASWDSFMETLVNWYNNSIQYAVDVWDWLTNFDFVGGLADWWDDLWSNTIKPFVASMWNPIVDFLQTSLDWAADAMSNIKIMGQQVTGLITAPNLSGMRMGEPAPTLPKLPPGATDVPLPPGYTMAGPRVNIEFWMHDIGPQDKAEVVLEGKRTEITNWGQQINSATGTGT